MVCYDLRFPELSLMLRTKGAISVSLCNFHTTKLHWQLLLQARAMDSQCYVLGAAQQGWHGEQRQTWGHAGITNSRGQLLEMITVEGHWFNYIFI